MKRLMFLTCLMLTAVLSINMLHVHAQEAVSTDQYDLAERVATTANAAALPVIEPDHYTTGEGGPYPILEYFTVPNNPVYQTPGFANATFNISGATNVNFELIDYNSNYTFPTYSGSTGPTIAMIYVDIYDENQYAVFRITAVNGNGTSTFDVAFRGGN
ncbi:hypothetical protein [Parapedobacter tibetensis]|uniref:hypothetical protein n=1 Tax=Parapedobacter tibetensis TaxID=2972951 RepID=UPI00214DE144|nr:hypothetical protein [Parapedobacter tibetensis]